MERVIQTYKNLLYKYFTYNRSHNFLDIYQKLVDNYNDTPHRSLNNITPSEVNENNQSIIWKQIYIDVYNKIKNKVHSRKKIRVKYKFKVNDYVRISYLSKSFSRSYNQKWTTEIFIIKQRMPFKGLPSYKLTDFKKSEDIVGVFYEEELQGVDKNDDVEYYIDKIIKKRKLKGRPKEVLVSFDGWPSPKYDEWVYESTLKDHGSKK